MLKRIVENEDFRKKYWPEFEINTEVNDYSLIILKKKNKYLHALVELINNQEKTPKIKYKQIIRIFDIV